MFALLGARVESLQSVGQGRHLKLQLGKGPCRFDAIFFSVTADECGIRVDDRVDAAFYLQGNTFRSIHVSAGQSSTVKDIIQTQNFNGAPGSLV